ncbi:MAG TPA: anti-sigma factor [Rubrivivax sp.]
MIDFDDPVERAAAAGEYVLGTLDTADHAAVEAALAGNAALRAEVYAWQDRLLGLSARAAPSRPSPQAWKRIEQAIDAAAPLPRTKARAASHRPPWWQHLRLWQGLSAVAVAASLMLAVLVLPTRAPEGAGPRYIAVLQSPENQSTGWVVEMKAGGTLRLVPVGDRGAIPPGRAWQFWTKPEGAAGPTSLGLVRTGQTVELPVSRLPGVGAQQLFEITLEPENGSPIGRPTGPILYVGRTVAL